MRAQARIGYALSRGDPRVDVAWLKTGRDHPDFAQLAVGGFNAIAPESAASRTLRAAGYTYDRISPAMLTDAGPDGSTLVVGAARYRALLVSDAQAVEPAMLRTVHELVDAGVPAIWVGEAPSRALGGFDTQARDALVAELWASLSERVLRVEQESAVPAALSGLDVAPEIEVQTLLGSVGIRQRDTQGGRVVWLFNEGELPQSIEVAVPDYVERALWLDPATGETSPLSERPLSISLPGLRGGVVYLEMKRGRFE